MLSKIEFHKLVKDRLKKKFNHVYRSALGSNTYTTWYTMKHNGIVTSNHKDLFKRSLFSGVYTWIKHNVYKNTGEILLHPQFFNLLLGGHQLYWSRKKVKIF